MLFLTSVTGLCCAYLLNHVWLFVTMWTVAHQAPLSIGFSRQEYWSGLPCLPPGHLPNPGIEPGLPHLPSEPLGKGILPSQILKIIRTGNSFLYLFHFLPFGVRMSITIIICLSHPAFWKQEPCWLAAITIFYFLSGYWLWKLINMFYYCDDITITHLIP